MHDVYKKRRDDLCSRIKDSQNGRQGIIMLSADFESERYAFRQDSTFYYFTGITEPGVVLLLNLNGESTLYIPKYAQSRKQWLTSQIDTTNECCTLLGIDHIEYLGEPVPGYSFSPRFIPSEFSRLAAELATASDSGMIVYVCQSQLVGGSSHQQMLYTFFTNTIRNMSASIADASGLVASMRRNKTLDEIRYISHAVGITTHAQQAAASGIVSGVKECQVQAVIEGVFTSLGSARCAFPSIVATGRNSTVLHYTDRNKDLEEGDLVVVDIGAEYGYYAADITRTYPVSGKFSPLQQEVYSTVLAAQAYIASIAKPGMYLNNPEHAQKSLHHRAVEFLSNAGYGEYFIHGIGHFLGLDVHDVGDVRVPLEPGDVFTIEPGIYIPDKKLGVRIEDDYVITDDGCFCLSDTLPKAPQEIEEMVRDSRA